MKSFSMAIEDSKLDLHEFSLRSGATVTYLVEDTQDGTIGICLVLGDINGFVELPFIDMAVLADGVSAESLISDMQKDENLLLEYFGGDYDGGKFALEFSFYEEISPTYKRKICFYSEVEIDQSTENRFFYPVWLEKK